VAVNVKKLKLKLWDLLVVRALLDGNRVGFAQDLLQPSQDALRLTKTHVAFVLKFHSVSLLKLDADE
jgi:hypothetical protein